MYLLLSGGILSIVFLLVFLPINRRANSLDRDLSNAHAALRLNSMHGTDIDLIFRKHHQISESTKVFQGDLEKFSSRFLLSSNIQTRIETPFQLVDYEQQRFRFVSDYLDYAQESGVFLDESLETQLPSYSLAVETPSLLWAQLECVRHSLFLAMASKVSVIRALKILPGRVLAEAKFSSADWKEFRIHLELNGKVGAVYRFINSLPLLYSELEAAGLPAPLTDKPAMMIDQFILNRTSDSPEDIHCEITIACFLKHSRTEAIP